MIIRHFEENGYVMRSVESDNVGWDLEAAKGKELLFLEVKGLAGDAIAVQLTPNEYDQMTRHRSKYRVCVVTGALSSEPALWVFAYVNGGWRNAGSEDVRLQVTERTSAVLTGVRRERMRYQKKTGGDAYCDTYQPDDFSSQGSSDGSLPHGPSARDGNADQAVYACEFRPA